MSAETASIKKEYTLDKINDLPNSINQKWLTQRRMAVTILFFTNGFGFASLPTRLPELQRFYNVSNTELGLILLCSSVGALAAMLMSSRIMTRFGSRKVATVTAIGFASVPPFLTFIPHISVLLPLFFILGAAIGSLEVAMNAQAIEVERLFERPLMSSFHAFFSIGGGLGAAFGAAMTWGNMSVFVHFLAVSVLSVGLLVWAAFHLLDFKTTDKTAETTAKTESQKSIKWQRLTILPIALLAFCSMASEGALTNWSAIFCSQELHTTAAESAFAFTIFTAAMTIGRLGGDKVTQRLGLYKTLIISLFIAFFGIFVLYAATNLTLVLISLASIGLGLSLTVPLTYSLAGNTEGVSPSVAIPMVSICGYASFFIMPPLVGVLSDVFGIRILVGILLVLGVAMLALLIYTSSLFKVSDVKIT